MQLDTRLKLQRRLRLSAELTGGAGLPLVALAVVAGVMSLLLLWWRRYLVVRLTAALAVVALLWGWATGQLPNLLPGVTVQQAAATQAVLLATLIALAVGGTLLVPSRWWLYATFQSSEKAA